MVECNDWFANPVSSKPIDMNKGNQDSNTFGNNIWELSPNSVNPFSSSVKLTSSVVPNTANRPSDRVKRSSTESNEPEFLSTK